MNQYMVIMTLTEVVNDEFILLIPRQRARINHLLDDGVVRSYSLALDRSRLWAIIQGKSAEEVMNIVAEFPIRKFVDVEIAELEFHNTTISALLAVSMN